MMISKINYEFFYLDFLLLHAKKITSWLKSCNAKHKNIDFTF